MPSLSRSDVHALACRMVQTVGGAASLVLVGTVLDPRDQGLFFTIGSLLALQVLAELGLSVVILQSVSHEASDLLVASDGQILGDEKSRARVYRLLRLGCLWFTAAAVLLGLFLLPLGRLFLFGLSPPSLHHDGPWSLAVVGMLLCLPLIPRIAVLEGCGQVTHAWRVRLLQHSTSNAVLVAGLLMGAGLWALAASQLAGAIAATLALSRHAPFFQSLHAMAHLPVRIHWRRQVWPFQWRIAVSWLSGFLLFQFAVPLVFAVCGPVDAGRLGLSWQAMRAASFLAITLLSTRSQAMGALIARQDRTQLDRLYRRASICSMGIIVALVAAFVLADAFLASHQNHFASRWIDAPSLLILAVATILQHLTLCQATYLRAHRQEPFLWPSVLGAVAFAASSSLAAPTFGVRGIVACYLSVTVIFGTALGTWIFRSYRRRQSNPSPAIVSARPHTEISGVRSSN